MIETNGVVLKSRGNALDMSAKSFGFLPAAPPRGSDRDELIAALNQHGYLFVRDMFPPDRVLQVRREICSAMDQLGLLDRDHDVLECIPKTGIHGNDSSKGSTTMDAIPDQCPAMKSMLYGAETASFFEHLLGGSVRHYDLTWFRGVAPGLGTVPHCDIVYMGRGTHQLLTCWVPYGHIPLSMGGLMILEDSMSEQVQQKIRNYLTRDVDEYCENRPLPKHVDLNSTTDNKVWNGWLASNPVRLRQNLGGRWLTAEFRPGDALIFSCKLIHGSLDNQCNAYRLSTDSRFQLADQSIDERFVGSGPFGHVGTAKRGRVC